MSLREDASNEVDLTTPRPRLPWWVVLIDIAIVVAAILLI